MKIEVKQYSLVEAVDVDSEHLRAEQAFYDEWAEDIKAEHDWFELEVTDDQPEQIYWCHDCDATKDSCGNVVPA